MRFPEDISWGAVSTPTFNTEIVSVVSGAEKRNRLWSTPQYKFNCSHAVKTEEQMEALIDFFYEVGGRAGAFRFKNWAEFELTEARSDITRPEPDTLFVYKKYLTYRKRITKIVDGTFKLYADGQQVLSGFDVNIDTGVITLQFPANYPSGTVFTCECQFDFWVRFNTDAMATVMDNVDTYSWVNIELVEIKE